MDPKIFANSDMPIFLLMNAEAAYHTGNEGLAIQRINEIRERARNTTRPKGSIEGTNTYEPYQPGEVSLDDIPHSLTGEELLEAIWKERRLELAMEGLRFWDLVRLVDIWKNYLQMSEPELWLIASRK